MARLRMDEADEGALLALTAGDVGVVLDATGGELPSVVHWGRALPSFDAPPAPAVVAAAVPVIGSNNPDVAPRVSVLPEHHSGWTGRPGLAGSRSGRQWSPRFRVTAVVVDGVRVSGFVSGGAASVEFSAADDIALL